MGDSRIKKIAIVGGGSAGWATASCFSRLLAPSGCEIALIESPDIGIIGVGEATIPSFVDFIQLLGIPEQEFIRETKATFKLGIKFTNWREQNHAYWHQFGAVGFDIDAKPFYQHWLKYRLLGGDAEYTDFSPSVAMAEKWKFYIQPQGKRSVISGSEYAWHFDAGLVAKFLASHALNQDVKRIQSTVQKVSLDDKGRIRSLMLSGGKEVEADFFIDCTGQKGLLIGEALGVGYQDWRKYLPVDSAVAVPTEKDERLAPYTESTAHQHGWQWCIPLQHRTGNGYVYCSDYCSVDEATELLLSNVTGKPLAEPRPLKFRTGKRDKFWHKNCLAIGLSAGFLEPLESTSIYLSMKAALNFVQMVPTIDCDEVTVNEFNRLMDIEYDCIRDFIVLHYCTSRRNDSMFWASWQAREIPNSLQEKIDLFRSQGRLYRNDMDLFSHGSWYAVLEGMGLRPGNYDHTVDASDFSKVRNILNSDLASLHDITEQLPTHREYVERVCS